MKKILVVDDDAVTRKLLSEVLIHKGYEVSVANDGIDAVLMVRQQNPDLVVLDIMMPHVNGYDVCRTIRNEPAHKDIPVILLTSRDQELDPSLMQLMRIDYLHKTCKPADLLVKIEKLLKA
jgi:CheY-like chemotaxis protein